MRTAGSHHDPITQISRKPNRKDASNNHACWEDEERYVHLGAGWLLL